MPRIKGLDWYYKHSHRYDMRKHISRLLKSGVIKKGSEEDFEWSLLGRYVNDKVVWDDLDSIDGVVRRIPSFIYDIGVRENRGFVSYVENWREVFMAYVNRLDSMSRIPNDAVPLRIKNLFPGWMREYRFGKEYDRGKEYPINTERDWNRYPDLKYLLFFNIYDRGDRWEFILSVVDNRLSNGTVKEVQVRRNGEPIEFMVSNSCSLVTFVKRLQGIIGNMSEESVRNLLSSIEFKVNSFEKGVRDLAESMRAIG